MDTQYWINVLCHNMIDNTLTKIVTTSKHIYGKAWYLVCIPYLIGVYIATPIPVTSTTIQSKEQAKEALLLSWNNDRYLLNRAIFSQWGDYMTPQAKIDINSHFLFSSSSDGINVFRRRFQ